MIGSSAMRASMWTGLAAATLATAGLVVSALGMSDEHVYTYDSSGALADFSAADEAIVEAAVAAHVALSLIPATTTETDVRGLKSAKPNAAGKVSRSMIRNLNRVTAPPVLLTNLRRIDSVPCDELFAPSGVKSRTRLGGLADETVESTRRVENVLLRWIGDERFCGPGAPKRCPPPADVPFVSTK